MLKDFDASNLRLIPTPRENDTQGTRIRRDLLALGYEYVQKDAPCPEWAKFHAESGELLIWSEGNVSYRWFRGLLFRKVRK